LSALDQIVKTTYFDVDLAHRVWRPHEMKSGQRKTFMLDDVKRLLRIEVEVWGGSGPNPELPTFGWGVEISMELLDPESMRKGRHEYAHNFGHLSFIGIQDVDYNIEKGYVQFNFHETEASSTGSHPRSLRIYGGGHVAFGGGMWNHK
jgi:hypothetical protein